MSSYRYVPDSEVWDMDERGLIIIKCNDSLVTQADAFDELRKRTAVECYLCAGNGLTLHRIAYEEEITIELNCHMCDGEAVLCAYCAGNSKTCECGKELKDET